MADGKIDLSLFEGEHVKLHIWEMERLIEDMRSERNPMTERLRHLLDRFIKADPRKDRV